MQGRSGILSSGVTPAGGRASCEIDAENLNMEVTDFATAPAVQGKVLPGLSFTRWKLI